MAFYKLMALDLDGTLLDDSGVIPEVHLRAIARAQRVGVQIALCSGRNLADACQFNEKLESPADWLITSNGADIRSLKTGKGILHRGLNSACLTSILQICAQFSTDPTLYTNYDMYYGDEFKRFAEDLQARGFIADFLALENYHYISTPEGWKDILKPKISGATKSLLYHRDPTVMDRQSDGLTKSILYHHDPAVVDQMMISLAETDLFELAPSSMYGGQMKNVEVNRKGVHKGAALAKLADHLGFGMAHVLALGDSDNDASMLRMAGLGIAMKNASAEIKELADVVTDANTDGGVAQAIEKYILDDANGSEPE